MNRSFNKDGKLISIESVTNKSEQLKINPQSQPQSPPRFKGNLAIVGLQNVRESYSPGDWDRPCRQSPM